SLSVMRTRRVAATTVLLALSLPGALPIYAAGRLRGLVERSSLRPPPPLPLPCALLRMGGPDHPRRRHRPPTHGPTLGVGGPDPQDRKSTRLNSSHVTSPYAVFRLKKKNN